MSDSSKQESFTRCLLILSQTTVYWLLYTSHSNQPKINIFIVFACMAVLAVGFASERRSSSKASWISLPFFLNFCSMFTRRGSSCYSVFVTNGGRTRGFGGTSILIKILSIIFQKRNSRSDSLPMWPTSCLELASDHSRGSTCGRPLCEASGFWSSHASSSEDLFMGGLF